MRSEFDTLEQYQESMKEFNENTRMGFEEFIQSHGSDRNKLQLRCTPYTSKKGGYGSFDLDFGLCVYQHQQLKIDGLQKRVDSTLKVVQSMRNEVKHGHLSDDESQTLSSYANDLEQALKGGDQNTEKQPNKHAENIATKGSWRHTPFRNANNGPSNLFTRSWRHTPFRNITWTNHCVPWCSWRHTPFRNLSLVLLLLFVSSWRHTPFRKHLIELLYA